MILRHTEVQEPMIISNPFVLQLTKLRLRLPQLLYSVFSPGFHITCSFSYYLYAVGFHIVTSLTFFPKTHSHLLYLTPGLSVAVTSDLQVQSLCLLQCYTSQQMCIILHSCSNWKPENPFSHLSLILPYLIHQNVSSTSEIAQNNSLSISTATSPVKVIIILFHLLHPLFLFWPFWCFLWRGPKAIFENWFCHFCLITLHCSGQFSRSVMFDSLQPRESQHARPPCPSPTPRVHPNSCPSSRWCHPVISSSVVPFSSCPQSLPASGSFPMSQLFAWGGQSTGVSALASFLPKNSQGWSPSEWTGWISLQSKEL